MQKQHVQKHSLVAAASNNRQSGAGSNGECCGTVCSSVCLLCHLTHTCSPCCGRLCVLMTQQCCRHATVVQDMLHTSAAFACGGAIAAFLALTPIAGAEPTVLRYALLA